MARIGDLSEGDIVKGGIDRISNSGNGIIELEDGRINVGQVKKDSVGEIILVVMIDNGSAFCLDESVKSESYRRSPPEDVPSIDQQDPIPVGNETLKSKRTGGKLQFGSSPKFCDKCGSVMKKKENTWTCRKCGFEIKNDPPNNISKLDTESETVENSESDLPPATNADSKQNKSETSSTSEKETNLEELKKRANSEASTNVPEAAITSSKSKPEYTRSKAIIDYVKKRADGVCEGCKKPAPFTSKTGDPYLHAHHVHELSEGGSDTPETVIALCPNCHYQVHHGDNGETYNQELIDELKEIE